MRTEHPATRRPEPAMWHGWWRAALWIPVGYAATRMVGTDAPLLAVVALAAFLAGVHVYAPGLVELTVGGGGLLVSLFTATDPRSAGTVIGDGGIVVLHVFGSIMLVSALVRLLGSGSPREMARHLLIATGVLELALVAARPLDHVASTGHDRFTMPVVLAGLLLLLTLAALNFREVGMPLLGVGLVVTQAGLLLVGTPFGVSPAITLVGSLTFAAVVLFLTTPTIHSPVTD